MTIWNGVSSPAAAAEFLGLNSWQAVTHDVSGNSGAMSASVDTCKVR